MERDLADLKSVWRVHGFQLDLTDQTMEWLTAKREMLDGRAAERVLDRAVQPLMRTPYNESMRVTGGQFGIVDWSDDGMPGASSAAGEGSLVLRPRV